MRRTHRALALLVLSLSLVGATTAVAAAAQPTPTVVEDQNDRLLRNLNAAQADRTQGAVELARSLERNLVPVAADAITAQPAPRVDPAVPGRDVNVLVTVLFGLVGGLVGGAAAMAGWTAASRRRPHRAAPVT